MHNNETYNKLNLFHKFRYRCYETLNRYGITGFPMEYMEISSEALAQKYRESGFELTERGWVKK